MVGADSETDIHGDNRRITDVIKKLDHNPWELH